MRAQDIIIKPILTEKSYSGIQNKIYTFKVASGANKIEIKKAVERFTLSKLQMVQIRLKSKKQLKVCSALKLKASTQSKSKVKKNHKTQDREEQLARKVITQKLLSH